MLVFEGKKKNRQREWEVFLRSFFLQKKDEKGEVEKKTQRKREKQVEIKQELDHGEFLKREWRQKGYKKEVKTRIRKWNREWHKKEKRKKFIMNTERRENIGKAVK